ncbi:hypothetical protein K438DRAFT_1817568, partial [Mycena galopus ATCC 62051]
MLGTRDLVAGDVLEDLGDTAGLLFDEVGYTLHTSQQEMTGLAIRGTKIEGGTKTVNGKVNVVAENFAVALRLPSPSRGY